MRPLNGPADRISIEEEHRLHIPERFVPGVDLPACTEQLKNDPSEAGKLRFFRILKAAQYLVPVQSAKNDIPLLQTQDGESFIPAFCTAEECEKGPFQDFSVISLDGLKHILTEHAGEIAGVALNPFGAALLMRQEQFQEIDALTEGMTVRRTDYSKPQILSPLKRCPVGLPAALTQLFRAHPEVYRAWLLAARPNIGDAPHKLFVIDFDGSRQQLFPLVAKAAEPFMLPGESFELMKADYALLESARAQCEPFYQKPKNQK